MDARQTATAPASRTGRRAFTLIELLVVIGVIAILIALMLPAVQQAREAARRMQCQNNLKQIGLALHNYHDAHRFFPIGSIIQTNGSGSANWSWMAQILPHLEQGVTYDAAGVGRVTMTAAIADAQRRAVMQSRLPSFRCPSDSGPDLNDRFPMGTDAVALALSNYVGSNGSGSFRTRFGKPMAGDDPSTGMNNGMFVGGSEGHRGPVCRRLADVQDGTSHTIVVGERAWQRGPADYGAAVAWGQRGGGSVAEEANGGYVCVMGVGWVPMNSAPYPYDPANPEHRRGFSSQHPGGAHFLYVDGSVHFLSETIHHTPHDAEVDSTFDRLLAVDDGQPIDATE